MSLRKPVALIVLSAVLVLVIRSVSVAFAVVPPPRPLASVAAAAEDRSKPPLRVDIPTVWFDITTPTTSSTTTVRINWCDDVSLVASSRRFTLNGTAVLTNYTTGSYFGCTAYAVSYVTVNLNVGSNPITARIRGDNFEWGEAFGVIVRENPPPPTYGVSLTPDGSTVNKSASTASTQYFKIKNTGNVTTTFQLTASCVGVTGCSLNTSSKALAAGVTDSVYVSFTPGAAGSFGRIDVTADSGGVKDDAYVTISVPASTPAANYPIVDMTSTHPGTTNEKSACLSISLGANSAAECGYLRIVHALPTITTLNRARTPTLLYNAGTNRSYQIFAAEVSIPAGSSGAPDSVKATLKIDGGAVIDSGTWTGSAWSVGGPSRRIGLGYNPATTGTAIRSYTLEVASFRSGVRYATTVTGEFAVVDRRSSAFGAGWWLAGLEQLIFTGNRILWVGGDASTRVYTKPDSTGHPNDWVAPAFDRPDSMFRNAGTGEYTRKLRSGLQVVFNSTGQHVRTVNRLGHTTTFAYTSGRLTSITVPPSSANAVYTFGYDGSSKLTSVAVRGPTGGSTRTTTVDDSSGVIRSIKDPGDSIAVRFFYVSPTNTHILARRDRMNHSAVFEYDAWSRMASVTDTLTGSTLVRDSLTIAESRGMAGSASVRSDSVVTLYNGPRPASDAVDITRFKVNQFGAPVSITNALGYTTVIHRDDIRWPALATWVRSPNGRSVVALYDKRGNARSVTDSSTVQSGTYAVSRYDWDQKWDTDTMRTSAMGIVTKRSYDAANGNLLWEQDARGISSRVSFSYWTSGTAAGLLQSTQLPGPISDTVAYDVVFGNASRTRTPLGYESKLTRDSIGRVLTTHTQIDSGVSVDALAREQRVTYDLRDLVTHDTVLGPVHAGVASQKIVVENSYDNERRPTRVRRKSDPDTLGIGWVTTDWRFDAIGRRVAEIAGDGKIDSTTYNAAGSASRVQTRRGHTIRFVYDAVGQMLERRADTVTYAKDSAGIAAWTALNPHNTPYPRLLKNAAGGMTIVGELATFTYDSVGNLLTANNADARVSRVWAKNGTLTSETSKVQTYARDDTTKHVYTMTYFYDLDGRRTKLKHPTQLAPRIGSAQADSVLYSYDAQTGALASVTDLLGNVFTFAYDLRNQLSRQAAPGAGLSDVFTYDIDGQLTQHTVFDSSSATVDNHPGAQLRNTSLRYDARGKVIRSVNALGVRDSLVAYYSGLGHLSADTASDSTSNSWGNAVRSRTKETFVQDALGNLARTTAVFSGVTVGASESSDTWHANAYRTDGTGRLDRDTIPNRTRQNVYDDAGNLHATFTTWVPTGQWADDRVSYYDAGGALVAADRRTAAKPASGGAYAFNFTFEEFRYDALGRRVLVRSRRQCEQTLMPNTVECYVSTIRRTVWDGSSELWEIQMPGYDTTSTTWLENDTTALPNRGHGGESAGEFDKNPFYGRVGYTYGLRFDAPLSLTRVNYADSLPNTQPFKRWAPFTILPHWNVRGAADNGSVADGTGSVVDGAQWMCTGSGSSRRCVVMQWPAGLFSYDRRDFQALSWQGTLLDEKRDETGTLYRRNRYFDPLTGRFTQEDPIGLAGGMNLYGYAGGDPVNYHDPFGLNPLAICIPAMPVCVAAAQATISTGILVAGAAAAVATSAGLWLSGRHGRALERTETDLARATEHIAQAATGPPNGDEDPNWLKDKLDDAQKHINNARKHIQNAVGRTRRELERKVEQAQREIDRLRPPQPDGSDNDADE